MGIGLSVIAPCLNEEANIGSLVHRTMAVLEALPVAGELVLIDDGSTDGTWMQIQEQAAEHPQVVGVRHASNQGIEAAWRTGLARAAGALVCLIDADLQNQPEDIPRLHAALAEGGPADIVQGVRHPAQGVRRLLYFSRALNVLLNAAFGTHLRDNKSGFLLCGRGVLADVLDHRYRYRYYQSFVGVVASVRGHRIVEVDTIFHPRVAGKSFLSAFPIGVSLRILFEMVKVRWELRATGSVRSSRDRALTTIGPAAGPEAVERWNERFSREHDIDEYYAASSWPIRWIEARRLAAIRTMLAALPRDRVLEVGCGGGHVLRLFPECVLTGVDVSRTMLEKARRNLQGCQATLLKGELRDLELPSGWFDGIICTEVLEHTVDPADVLNRMRRLARPGGRVVVTLPNDRLIGRLKQLVRWSGLTRTPWFRRIGWGADSYHLHVWTIAEMRTLLGRDFEIVAERFVPSRLLPVRCCFQCVARPVPSSAPPPGSGTRRRRILKPLAVSKTS